ncbi:hypothetical protein D9M68_821540 [compost metagenome]
MAGDEADGLGAVAMGERDAEAAGEGQGRGDARNDRYGDAMRFEHGDFLARAAKDHRVAGLEADHMLALPGQRQHGLVDIFLPARVAPGALAHQHALGLATRQFEHVCGNQIIEQDDIGGLERADGLDGEEIRIAGAGTHEGDAAAGWQSGEMLDIAVRCGG